MSVDYITAEDTAEILGVSYATLAVWRHKGSGPPWAKFAGRVWYLRSEVEAWAAQHPETPKRVEEQTKGPLLTQGQVAAHLHVSTLRLHAWRLLGGGPPYVLIGKRFFYFAEGLRRWQDEMAR